MAEHEEHGGHDEGHGSKGHGGGHGGGGHGGAAHEEHEGAPEWLISFADNVTLMMGFFVILLAMNIKEPTSGGIGGKEANGGTPSARTLDLAIAIRSAFHNPVNINSANPYDSQLVRRLREREGQSGSATEDGPDGQFDSVQSLAPTDYYTPSGIVHFALGSAELTAVGHDEVAQIAREVRDLTYVIEIRGHASPFEVFRNEREGMFLSFERALAVADALVGEGVPWDNMRVVSCSDGVPLSDRSRTREEAERSQIVEVITTGEALQPRTGMEGPESPAAARGTAPAQPRH